MADKASGLIMILSKVLLFQWLRWCLSACCDMDNHKCNWRSTVALGGEKFDCGLELGRDTQ